MINRDTMVIELNTMAPLVDDSADTLTTQDPANHAKSGMMIPYTPDFNSFHNIINRRWLLRVCHSAGARIDTRSFNGYIRLTTLSDPACSYTTIFEDLC